MNKLQQELRNAMLEIGVTPKAASRRTNKALKEPKVVARAILWGIKTFKQNAPTKLSEINKDKHEDIFKAIANISHKHARI